MEEKNILFIVLELLDTYYERVGTQQQKKEFQLTAVAAILIASKYLQIEHVKLDLC